MIKYYVSTVDRYNDGWNCGAIKTGSEWSSPIEETAENEEQALKDETIWVANSMRDDYTIKEIKDVDTETGRIVHEDLQGNEFITEVSIDFIEEI